MNTRMALVASAGSESGRKTRTNACQGEHPSTRAARYSSSGSARKNEVISQSVSGSANVVYGSTRPGSVSRSPSARSTRYSGLTVAMGGNIETASANASSAGPPGSGSFAIANAAADPMASATAVVAAATRSEFNTAPANEAPSPA